jgi:hypothetical protein
LSQDTWTSERLILLRRNLTDYFSDDELRALCSEIGVNYDRLRGQGKAAKASELLRYLAARGRIPELVARASQLRPDVSWGEMSVDLAAGTGAPLERPVPFGVTRLALMRAGGLVITLIVVVGLAFILSGGLHMGRPGPSLSPLPGTPSPVPMTSTPAMPTPTPTVEAVTATPPRTPLPPTETRTPPVTVETLVQTPTPTFVFPVFVRTGTPRAVTPVAPLRGVCVQSPVVTFMWSGVVSRPGESFVVAITPSQVNHGKCSSNYAEGVQYSPPLKSPEWTTDISAPTQVPPACAGLVEWTVYIKSAAGDVTQVAPIQYFEWNPLGCKR